MRSRFETRFDTLPIGKRIGIVVGGMILSGLAALGVAHLRGSSWMILAGCAGLLVVIIGIRLVIAALMDMAVNKATQSATVDTLQEVCAKLTLKQRLGWFAVSGLLIAGWCGIAWLCAEAQPALAARFGPVGANSALLIAMFGTIPMVWFAADRMARGMAKVNANRFQRPHGR